MDLIEVGLALILGFILGYLVVSFLESSAQAQIKLQGTRIPHEVECYYDSRLIGGSNMERGWICL